MRTVLQTALRKGAWAEAPENPSMSQTGGKSRVCAYKWLRKQVRKPLNTSKENQLDKTASQESLQTQEK